MTITDFHSAARAEKEWLVEELTQAASWHALRAKRYRGGECDAGCAEALRELAKFVNAMPVSHPVFFKLAEISDFYLQQADVVGLGYWLNETKCLMKQICFSSFQTPEDLIERLIELTDQNQVDKLQ